MMGTRTQVGVLLLCVIAALSSAGFGRVTTSSNRRVWHKVTLTFDGPERLEDSATFRDYRLTVKFRKGSKVFSVPGYFAADGDAAMTSSSSGNKWRVNFSPDTVGRWSWSAEFVTGRDIAINDRAPKRSVGAVDGFRIDGSTGSFTVSRSNKSGIDNRSPTKGRLEYVEKHHLRWAGSGDYFLKFGADSPENFLAYNGFDGTPDNLGKGDRKNYTRHISDYNGDGDLWQGRGHGIFGAINYLARKGVNVHSFLTGNIGGDDRKVFMYVSDRDRDRDVFDVSKLDQWERVFTHMDKKGMFLHFKTQETENDGGVTKRGVQKEIFLRPDQRKLYYRELVARFSHHLALNWNVGEENTNTPKEREDFSNWISDLDPYKHSIVIHTFPNPDVIRSIYGDLIANAARNSYTGASLQLDSTVVHEFTLELIRNTTRRNRPWVVACDETGPASRGIVIDGDREDRNHNAQRRDVIYGNLMAGGAGIETYTGSSRISGDQALEDYRLYDEWWTQGKIALDFFATNNIPFEDMNSDDRIASSGAWVLRNRDTVVVYTFRSGTTTLDLSADGGTPFSVSWYDPVRGGAMRTGSVDCIEASRSVSVGRPPSDSSPDWVVLLRRGGCSERPETTCFAPALSGPSALRNWVFIEAEKVTDTNGWERGSEAGGRKFLEWKSRGLTLFQTRRSPRGTLKYNFIVPTSRDYFLNVVISGRGSTARERSVWVSVDGKRTQRALAEFDDDRASSRRVWEPTLSYEGSDGEPISPVSQLSAGKHTLEIFPSESDTRVDQIYLLTYDLFEGVQQAAAYRRFKRGPSTTVPC